MTRPSRRASPRRKRGWTFRHVRLLSSALVPCILTVTALPAFANSIVSHPPAGTDSFYAKYLDASGVAILVSVMSLVAGHAFGNGVACWVIISEIYPTKVRGRGMSIATTALWLVGYLGNQLFPIMQKHLGSDGTFWVFGAGALLTIILVGSLVPETKGRSLEQITRGWLRQQSPARISL